MTSEAKPTNLGWIHKLLMLFVAINIIGEIGNVIAWWAVPSMQISLNGGELNGVTSPPSLLSSWVGSQNALIIGSVVLLAVAGTYAYSLIGLRKKQQQAPIAVIIISIVNRIIALFIFAISEAFIFWAVWTAILVVFSYLDWQKLKAIR
jgi:hypothetical protein